MAAKSSSADQSEAPRRRGRPLHTPEQQQARHAEVRERICVAALTLFDNGGIDAISMREVAKEVGSSPMMLYRYFATRDHLLQELRTQAFEQLRRTLSLAASNSSDASDRLRQILLAYLQFGLEERRSYRLMFDYWVYDNADRMLEDFGDAIHRQSGAWNVLLAAVIEYFDVFGVEGDPLTTAHLIWAGLHGLVSLEASRKLYFGKTFEELMVPMVNAIMAGVPQPAKPRK